MYAWIALATAAGHIEVPASESRAVWEPVVAMAGLELGGASSGPRAQLLAGDRAWTLVVLDVAGARHVIEVPPPADDRARESLVWLAASLMDPLEAPKRSSVPPSVTTTVVAPKAAPNGTAKRPPKETSAAAATPAAPTTRGSTTQASTSPLPGSGAPAAPPSEAAEAPPAAAPRGPGLQTATTPASGVDPTAKRPGTTAPAVASSAPAAPSSAPTAPESREPRAATAGADGTPASGGTPKPRSPTNDGPREPRSGATPTATTPPAPATSTVATAAPDARPPSHPPPVPWIALSTGAALRAEVAVAPHERLGGGVVFGPYRAGLWLGATTPATLPTFGAGHTVWSADVSGEVRWQPPLRVGPALTLGAGADVRSYLEDAQPVTTTTPPFVVGGAGVALAVGAFDAALLARGVWTLVPTDLEKGTTEVTEGAIGLDVALEVGVHFGRKP